MTFDESKHPRGGHPDNPGKFSNRAREESSLSLPTPHSALLNVLRELTGIEATIDDMLVNGHAADDPSLSGAMRASILSRTDLPAPWRVIPDFIDSPLTPDEVIQDRYPGLMGGYGEDFPQVPAALLLSGRLTEEQDKDCIEQIEHRIDEAELILEDGAESVTESMGTYCEELVDCLEEASVTPGHPRQKIASRLVERWRNKVHDANADAWDQYHSQWLEYRNQVA